MSWAKLDDAFTEHPKVVGLSDAAFRLHVSGICYSARFETDGEIPAGALARMGGTLEVAAELVDAALWDTTSRGAWAIHDYLLYNPSKVQKDELRKKTIERQQRWRNGVSNGVSAPSPVPDPVPDPLPLSASNEAQGAAIAAVPRKGVDDDFLRELQEANPTVNVQQVYERAQNRKNWDGYKDKRRALRDHVGYALEDQRKVNGNGRTSKHVEPDGDDPISRRLRFDAEQQGRAGMLALQE